MFLGIDISKANFDAVLLRGTAKPRHKAFPNTPAGYERLLEWLADHLEWLADHSVHACLEATGTYGDALARFLHANGHTVSVVNPAQIKAFGGTQLSRTKTDKADAGRIAQFCQMYQPPTWTPPTPDAAQLQALVRRLETLQEMRQMEQNRLDTSSPVIRTEIQEHVSYLDAQIKKTEQAIRDHINQNPMLKAQRDLLVSIPGIADTTAAALLSELLDVSQFTEARQSPRRVRWQRSRVWCHACVSPVRRCGAVLRCRRWVLLVFASLCTSRRWRLCVSIRRFGHWANVSRRVASARW